MSPNLSYANVRSVSWRPNVVSVCGRKSEVAFSEVIAMTGRYLIIGSIKIKKNLAHSILQSNETYADDGFRPKTVNYNTRSVLIMIDDCQIAIDWEIRESIEWHFVPVRHLFIIIITFFFVKESSSEGFVVNEPWLALWPDAIIVRRLNVQPRFGRSHWPSWKYDLRRSFDPTQNLLGLWESALESSSLTRRRASSLSVNQ